MDVYRPLRLSLFIYDFIRFGGILMIISMGAPAADPAPYAGTVFPYFVFAAPQALFPLMSLFLWLNLSRHLSYIPLYMAGKIIGIILSLMWLFSAFNSIILHVAIDFPRNLVLPAAVLVFALTDALSMLGISAVGRKAEEAAGVAAENRAALDTEECEDGVGASQSGGTPCE